ncbi:hypothetical protein F4808DRAFT_430882 [Astrocystis sublimbata]|nr:hypothetical protein F4808DRAFT_430882 [Astrocystis sublimbata]
MSFEQKGPASASNYEVDVDPRAHQHQKHQGTIRLLNSVRVGLTVLALLSGLAILGTSANAIMVYDSTHISSGFHLALWPDSFDLRPTVALVVGSTLVVVANLVSLAFSKVRVLQSHTLLHTTTTLAAPFISFVASLIAIIFFYAVNASTSADTLQSWSCQWGYAAMQTQPHFGTLCSQSKTALYLAVVLVPVEFMALLAAGAQMVVERKTRAYVPSVDAKPASPALS